jgi:hypothetical protein
MFARRHAKQLKALQERLKKIEQTLDELSQKHSAYTVNIDHLHAHNPVLEELTFQLERLDIDTVSGALNLGNNFGVRVIQDDEQTETSAKPEDKTRGGKDTPDESRPTEGAARYSSHMETTANGFRFRFSGCHNDEKG